MNGYVTLRCANGHLRTLRGQWRAIKCSHIKDGYRCPLVAKAVR